MNDRAAGEIDQAELGEETAAPHPVGARHIDQQQPQRAEQREGGKLQPVGDRAADQRAGDDREGHLVDHEQHLGDRAGEAAHRVEADPDEEEAIEAAEDRAVAAEGE